MKVRVIERCGAYVPQYRYLFTWLDYETYNWSNGMYFPDRFTTVVAAKHHIVMRGKRTSYKPPKPDYTVWKGTIH